MKLGDYPPGTIYKWHCNWEYMILPRSSLLNSAELLRDPTRVPVLSLTDLSVGWDSADAEDMTIIN